MKKIKKVAVVGGGSAGFLSALALQHQLPELAVSVIKSEKIPIIGVGESTTWTVPSFVAHFAGLDRGRFYRAVQPALKGGLRLYWGKRHHFDYTFELQMGYRSHDPLLRKNAAFYCFEDFSTPSVIRETMERDLSPLIADGNGGLRLAGPIGWHIENEHFVGFLEKEAKGRGIEVLDSLIEGFERDAKGFVRSAHLEGGGKRAADLWIDASGFRTRLLGQELGVPFRSFKSSLYCDRAVVGGYMRSGEPVLPYTGAVTMTSGWTFVIEHWDRVNVGYIFSSAFQSDESAERELRALLKGKPLGKTRVIHFRSGRHERAWEKNVVGIGNACGFVEPLQSTALHVICDSTRCLVGALTDSDLAPTEHYIANFNHLVADQWDHIRRFLAVHYKFNDRLSTPFWKATRAEVDLAGAEALVEHYQEAGPSNVFGFKLETERGFAQHDGFLVILVGLQVPTKRKLALTAAERKAWKSLVARVTAPAARAISMKDAYARTIGSPGFDFDQPGLEEM